MSALVDTDRACTLSKFTWRAVQHKRSFYAKTTFFRKGHRIDLSMHRFIARTPAGEVCHHINGNSLDNRAENLVNMTKESHNQLHAHDKILIKFEEKTSGHPQ